MLDRKDTTSLDVKGTVSNVDSGEDSPVVGALLFDPCIGDCGRVQLQYPTYYFVKANNVILNINQTHLETMSEASQRCGWNDVGLTEHNKYRSAASCKVVPNRCFLLAVSRHISPIPATETSATISCCYPAPRLRPAADMGSRSRRDQPLLRTYITLLAIRDKP